jgi:hypothetical protein
MKKLIIFISVLFSGVCHADFVFINKSFDSHESAFIYERFQGPISKVETHPEDPNILLRTKEALSSDGAINLSCTRQYTMGLEVDASCELKIDSRLSEEISTRVRHGFHDQIYIVDLIDEASKNSFYYAFMDPLSYFQGLADVKILVDGQYHTRRKLRMDCVKQDNGSLDSCQIVYVDADFIEVI